MGAGGGGEGEGLPPAHGTIRISRIDGRYLVFDPDDVARLRRGHGSGVVLTGTAPQQPTQNIFLSLPAELAPAEARALVDQAVAFVVDDTAVLTARLRSLDPATRSRYHDSLRRHCNLAQQVISEKKQQSRLRAAVLSASAEAASRPAVLQPAEAEADQKQSSLGLTPTVDKVLFTPDDDLIADLPPASPLYNHLMRVGYYMTPGLRFGTQYSAYPGDPLRFHAHFLANEYNWDQEIAVLDLVGIGRLATGVKKSFLFGAEDPQKPAVDGTDQLRSFCLEWAVM